MKPINVTEPFLPPLHEYVAYLEGIWERKSLTNQGVLVQQLEQKIQAYHQLEAPVHCVANGGLGLQIILKALGVKGEVVTTPFSYVATTSCPLWEGCTVKFADIEPDHLTINPAAVAASITPATEAILATHVFGNPCDCEALEEIATKHGIALIFDAAHAFGVRYRDKSILDYGDASMVSMHATKLFHTVEGGFVVAKDTAVAEKVEWMRRFGHRGHEEFYGVGINAKMSELHAAMGLCNFKYLDALLARRKFVCEAYDATLRLQLSPFKISYRQGADRNYSYYPAIFDSERSLQIALTKFNQSAIYPRRYFHPNLSDYFARDALSCPSAISISRRILCLPLSNHMSENDIERVTHVLSKQ